MLQRASRSPGSDLLIRKRSLLGRGKRNRPPAGNTVLSGVIVCVAGMSRHLTAIQSANYPRNAERTIAMRATVNGVISAGLTNIQLTSRAHANCLWIIPLGSACETKRARRKVERLPRPHARDASIRSRMHGALLSLPRVRVSSFLRSRSDFSEILQSPAESRGRFVLNANKQRTLARSRGWRSVIPLRPLESCAVERRRRRRRRRRGLFVYQPAYQPLLREKAR